MTLDTTEFLRSRSDRSLLELLVNELILKADEGFVEMELRSQLKEKIAAKWLEYTYMNNAWDGNVTVTVCIRDGENLDKYNVSIRNVVMANKDIETYMNEVINPQSKALVSRIVRTRGALSNIEIESIEISKLEG